MKSSARGSEGRKWAKYIVHYHIWDEIRSDIRKRSSNFIRACQTADMNVVGPLDRLVDAAFRIAVKSYKLEAGGDAPSRYFRRREENPYDAFLKTWTIPEVKTLRTRCANAWRALLDSLS